MASPWFYSNGSEQYGPVSDEELKALVKNGILTRESLVWKEGMPAWTQVGQVPGLIVGPPPLPGASASWKEPGAVQSLKAHTMENGTCVKCGCSEKYIVSTSRMTCAGGHVRPRGRSSGTSTGATSNTKSSKQDNEAGSSTGCGIFLVVAILFLLRGCMNNTPPWN
ncbi:MAG: DUF4339 domain-containing protein [Planctomycetes bacterium]|nr:DUF4339 domain-containing protein [Planctomycetota bacterium]